MSSKTPLKLNIIGLLIALIFLGGFSVGFGALNEEMVFQGKLQNSDGTNVADGAYNMVFKIYTQAEDGIRDSSTSRGLGDVYKRQF